MYIIIESSGNGFYMNLLHGNIFIGIMINVWRNQMRGMELNKEERERERKHNHSVIMSFYQIRVKHTVYTICTTTKEKIKYIQI